MSQFYTVTLNWNLSNIMWDSEKATSSKLSGAAEGYVFLKDPLGQAKGGTERQTLKGKDTTKKFKQHKQNIQARREREKKGLKDQMFVHTRGKETKNKETDLNQRKIVRLNT